VGTWWGGGFAGDSHGSNGGLPMCGPWEAGFQFGRDAGVAQEQSAGWGGGQPELGTRGAWPVAPDGAGAMLYENEKHNGATASG